MRTITRLAAAAGGIGLAGTALLFGAPSASAAITCGAGRVCLFEDIRYSGGEAQFVGSISNYANYRFNNGHQLTNRASSVFNNGYLSAPSYVRLYQVAGYGGRSLCVGANHGIDWLGNYSDSRGSWNDNVESHLWATSC
jgi:hypothetical protein